MFSGSTVSTLINVGIIVYFFLAAGIEMLVGRKRGWKRQLVHIGFSALGIIGAFFITEGIISALNLDSETWGSVLNMIYGDNPASDDMSYQIMKSIDSDLINLILQLPLSTVIAPLLFTAVFIVLNLILKIICFIVNKFVPAVEGKAPRILGMAIGFIEGAIVAAFFMLPITAYTSIADEAVEASDSTHSSLAEDIHEAYDEYVAPISRNPITSMTNLFGGGAMIDAFATVDIGDDEINMRDEIVGMVKFVSNAQKLSEINWEKLSAQDKKTVGDLIDSIANSKFYTKSFVGIFKTAATVSKEQNSAILADASDGELVVALFSDFLEILGDTTEETIRQDLLTFKEVFFILSDGDVILAYNATTNDKLDDEDMIDIFNASHDEDTSVLDALVSTLRDNKRTAELVETLTELALTIIMENVGLDDESEQLYDNIVGGLDDINAINPTDYTTEEYKKAVSDTISSTLADNDIVIDDAILEDLTLHAIELREEKGELTETEIQDVLIKYFESYENNKVSP